MNIYHDQKRVWVETEETAVPSRPVSLTLTQALEARKLLDRAIDDLVLAVLHGH